MSRITNGEFGFTLLEAELGSGILGIVYEAGCVFLAGLSLIDFNFAL